MIDGVRGTRALEGAMADKYIEVTNTLHNIAKEYNFGYIKLPTLEKEELFIRSVGENTDIVTKQMFNFEDKKGRNLVLRPEGTAGLARHYLSKKYVSKKYYYYIEQMFRYERPQKGRYREFHQAGAEIIGKTNDSVEDILTILQFSIDFIENSIPSKNTYTLEVNSIGKAEDRNKYNVKLKEYLNSQRKNLSKDSLNRIDTNPMRILDSKDKNDIRIIAAGPQIADYRSKKSEDQYNKILQILDKNKIKYFENPYLVRGLDYYNDFTFEIFPNNERGSQDAIGGGGQYDDLSKMIGNKSIPGVGVAFGIDRIIELQDYED